MLAHVDFKLLRRPPPLPAVILIAETEISLGRAKHESAGRDELDVEKSEKQSAKVSEVRHSTLRRLEGCNHHNEDNDPDQVFGFDRERKRKEEDLAVAVKHSEGDQQAVDSTRSPDGWNQRRRARQPRVGNPHRYQRCTGNTEKIKFEELARTPILLLLRAEHPQRQHVDQQVAHAGM